MWTQQLLLDGDLAIAETKRLRYCLLHVAGILVRSGRQVKLRLADDWPWTDALIAAFERLQRRRLTRDIDQRSVRLGRPGG